MRRRLLNFVAAAATVLLIGAVAMWARSFRYHDSLIAPWPAEGIGMMSLEGRVLINLRLTHVTPHRYHFTTRSYASRFDTSTLTLTFDVLHTNESLIAPRLVSFDWRYLDGLPPDNARWEQDGTLVIP